MSIVLLLLLCYMHCWLDCYGYDYNLLLLLFLWQSGTKCLEAIFSTSDFGKPAQKPNDVQKLCGFLSCLSHVLFDIL